MIVQKLNAKRAQESFLVGRRTDLVLNWDLDLQSLTENHIHNKGLLKYPVQHCSRILIFI